jgi:hypothetical protein
MFRPIQPFFGDGRQNAFFSNESGRGITVIKI